MTRDELIARIEAGETGPDIDGHVAELAGLRVLWDGAEPWYVKEEPSAVRQTRYAVPAYTTSFDAAAKLADGLYWTADMVGKASIFTGPRITVRSFVPNNPAAALVAAWLKATA